MPRKDIVVIGASAGGIDALRTIVAALPESFPAALFVVIHTAPDSPALLARILDGAGPLHVSNAVNGERIVPGRMYVAPPDHHLLVMPGHMTLTSGPRENRFRPAIDPLFRSAAQTYGPRVIGVVLTGGLDDGTNGLWAIRQLGGTAVVQDPATAVARSMPESAIAHVRVDHVAPLDELAALLVRLVALPADTPMDETKIPQGILGEVRIANEENSKKAGVMQLGEPSIYACPECHGVLLRMRDGIPERFRCHTGHAYTLESLLVEMDGAIEDSLWSSVRAIEERVMLLRDAAEHLRREHREKRGEADALDRRAAESQRRADLIRAAVFGEDEAKAGVS